VDPSLLRMCHGHMMHNAYIKFNREYSIHSIGTYLNFTVVIFHRVSNTLTQILLSIFFFLLFNSIQIKTILQKITNK